MNNKALNNTDYKSGILLCLYFVDNVLEMMRRERDCVFINKIKNSHLSSFYRISAAQCEEINGEF
jgi:hypothetical protein